MEKILVVDDEQDICEILQFNLETEGYEVDVANSAEEALKLDLKNYQLILLDVMMGEISGFQMARIMKQKEDTANIPIIFITALDGENDTVKGLNIGADDYIAKPLSMREVKARVKAVLRRTAKEKTVEAGEHTTIGYEGLKIDVERKLVTVNGKEVRPDDTIVMGRTVDVNITRLRKKIGEYGKCIKTRFGYGYTFERI